MNAFLAQATYNPPLTFWGAEPGSSRLFMMIGIALVLGFGAMALLLAAPTRLRRPVVATCTFLAGLFFVLAWLWPKAQGRAADDLPLNQVEAVGFWIEDATTRIGTLATVISSFLLGLGVYSLLRIHLGRVIKMQKDWTFSVVLLVSMFAMTAAGYWNWYMVKFAMKDTDFSNKANWIPATYVKDFLFDGILQKMDGAMFSVIAFYIMSAAYRAFRVRSVEATILLSTALIIMLSLLAVVDMASNTMITGMTGGDKNHFLANFTISEVAGFIRTAFQSPSIRAIDFGIGVGALAMGLRLWLSLERGGATG